MGTVFGGIIGGIAGSYCGSKLVKALRAKYAGKKLTKAQKKRLNNVHTAYLRSLKVLECDEKDSTETINRWKKWLLKKYHPDKNTHLNYSEQKECEEKFIKVMLAYEVVLQYRDNV